MSASLSEIVGREELFTVFPAVVVDGRLPLPALPVERCGRVALRNFAGITALVDNARGSFDVAQKSFANKRRRSHELFEHRALLSANLKDFPVFLLRRANELILFQRQG